MKTAEDMIYRIGKIAFLPIVAGMLFLNRIPISLLRKLPACTFRQVTGLFCPGCGGTRAVYYLAKGQLLQSFLYHPFVLYAAAAYLLFMTAEYGRRHIAGLSRGQVRIEYFLYPGIVILFLQWLLKLAGFLAA